ncbi:hypothetical protein [Flaviaesturariibacter amylovorans]|uniref:Glycosyltransferase RgtA/B/C/D-like domain-containing protein n=1 Tax=Flaviaesturariibacter amylovorans TaxID=1084520 RepID=A0ABP8GLU8_9BACT
MKYLLFLFYLLVFVWMLRRIAFFRNSGLTQRQVQIVFLVKVFAGIFYGWVGIFYSMQGQLVDTWWLHIQGLKEGPLLRSDPGSFFAELFRNNYKHGFGRFLSSRDSWWNDLHTNLFIKLLALLNLLSGGFYFVNVLFFAFVSMIGSVGLFRVFHQIYPDRKWAVFAGSFLVPSYLFWTSGIYRDALVALALGLILYCFYSGLRKGWTARYLATLFSGLLLLLVFRNYLLVVLLPALVAWWVAARSRRHPMLVCAAVYAGYLVLFFNLRYLVPALDFPRVAVEKQEDFFTLIGNSIIPAPKLEPTFLSFLANGPHALELTLLRPYPWDVYNFFVLVSCLETYGLLALFGYWLVRRNRGQPLEPFLAFSVFFALSLFLMIGFTVNFLGAMVRYRSLVLPLLVTPMLCSLAWPKRQKANALVK